MSAPPRTKQNRATSSSASARGRWAHVYGALDLGTHNCRLLIARPTREGFRVIDAFSRIVRLGEGVKATGRLSRDAQDRTIDALGVCADKLRRQGVGRVRGVATEACRLASNGTEFLDRIQRRTGIAFDLIDSEEEARLAIGGCVPLLDAARERAIVFDIGGGSTQVIWLQSANGETRLRDSISIPFGVVTLGERIGTRALTREDYDRWIDEVEAELKSFCQLHGISEAIAGGNVQMLGTSGTVTTLTGIDLDLPKYIRSAVDGATLEFSRAREISDWLRQKELTERTEHPCIGRERADLVIAGCIILEAICRCWPVGELRVADRGVREGILLDLMDAADKEQ